MTTRSDANFTCSRASAAHHVRVANLAWTRASGAHLAWTHVSGAHLAWTRVSGAHLAWTHVSGAHLAWTHVSGAHLAWTRTSAFHLNVDTRVSPHIASLVSRVSCQPRFITACFALALPTTFDAYGRL